MRRVGFLLFLSRSLIAVFPQLANTNTKQGHHLRNVLLGVTLTERKEWGNLLFSITRCWAVSCLLCCLHSHTSARVSKIAIRLWSLESERVSEWRYRRSTRIFLSCPRLKMESRVGIQSNVDATHAARYLIHQLKLNLSMGRHYSIQKDSSQSEAYLYSRCLFVEFPRKMLTNPLKNTLNFHADDESKIFTAYFFIVLQNLSASSASARMLLQIRK
jgi:hypothetical protein